MSFSIRRGDIFYVHKFGIQVGSEEHTGRPGVVVSCDEGNRYSETVQVAFCTTQPKSNLPTHVEILSTGRASTVMCEQINTVSLERLGNYIGRCTAEEMRDIDIAVATALGLKKYPGLIERLKEREQQVEKREAVVGKETDTKAALELATVKAERDTLPQTVRGSDPWVHPDGTGGGLTRWPMTSTARSTLKSISRRMCSIWRS